MRFTLVIFPVLILVNIYLARLAAICPAKIGLISRLGGSQNFFLLQFNLHFFVTKNLNILSYAFVG